MSILIVDDSRFNLRLLKSILQEEGFSNILTATSAMEAFRLMGIHEDGIVTVAQESQGPPTDVELILMDVIMPEIDGIEACRRIKAHPRELICRSSSSPPTPTTKK